MFTLPFKRTVCCDFLNCMRFPTLSSAIAGMSESNKEKTEGNLVVFDRMLTHTSSNTKCEVFSLRRQEISRRIGKE